MRLSLGVIAIVSLSPILSHWAAADAFSFTVSGGYSNVQFNHKADLYYSRDGGYIDGEFMWRPLPRPFPLALGAGISASGYDDSEYVLTEPYYDKTGRMEVGSYVSFFSAEARAAAPISFASGGGPGWFVTPKVGAGLLIDHYSIAIPVLSLGGASFSKQKHGQGAFDVRPAVQVGYSWGWGSAGAEVSYMAAFGDFGKLGSVAQEIRAGAFFRLRF